MNNPEVQIFIFSYNRGALLENSVNSALHCIPNANIMVYDDQSDDFYTRKVLRDLQNRNINILFPDRYNKTDKDQFRGGFYDNMRDVIKNHIDPTRFEYTAFVQDDMQFVRPLQSSDYANMEDVFLENKRTVFLYPVFNRGSSELSDHRLVSAQNIFAYSREKEYEYGGFSAVFIARCDRLSSIPWEFSNNEEETSRLALAQHGPMYEYPLPFLAYMPAPRGYRFKRTTLAVRIWDQLYTGCFPISYLKESDVERMRSLFPHKAVTAEDFLESPTFGPHPWPVFRHENSPIWLRFLDRLELLANRVFRRFLKMRKSSFYRRNK